MSEVTKKEVRDCQERIKLTRATGRDIYPSLLDYVDALENYAHVPPIFKKPYKKPEGYEGLTDLTRELEDASLPSAVHWMIEEKFLDRDDDGLIIVHEMWTGLGKEIHEPVYDIHAESWHECTKVYLPRKLTDVIKGTWALKRQTQRSKKVMHDLSKRAAAHA